MHYQHIQNFLYKNEADKLETFLETVPWEVVSYYHPKRGYVITPRETWVAGFHQQKMYSLYNNDYEPNKIPNFLLPLKKIIEEELNSSFNFILFSKYRDEKDSITFHSDDERFLGSEPKIASLSIGYSRDILLRNKMSKKIQTFNLKHGDLFVMQKDCQKKFEHSIQKQETRCYTRYSLTFRKVLNEAGSKNYYRYNVMPLSKLIF